MVENTARSRPSQGPSGRGEYEEYHPYGSTAWWAEKRGVEVSRKRYRYTGQEKDEETGLCYHHHRYYMPWLGRWASADPAGLVDGPNRFAYGRGSPATHVDPNGCESRTQEPDPSQEKWAFADTPAGFEQLLSAGRTDSASRPSELERAAPKSSRQYLASTPMYQLGLSSDFGTRQPATEALTAHLLARASRLERAHSLSTEEPKQIFSSAGTPLPSLAQAVDVVDSAMRLPEFAHEVIYLDSRAPLDSAANRQLSFVQGSGAIALTQKVQTAGQTRFLTVVDVESARRRSEASDITLQNVLAIVVGHEHVRVLQGVYKGSELSVRQTSLPEGLRFSGRENVANAIDIQAYGMDVVMRLHARTTSGSSSPTTGD